MRRQNKIWWNLWFMNWWKIQNITNELHPQCVAFVVLLFYWPNGSEKNKHKQIIHCSLSLMFVIGESLWFKNIILFLWNFYSPKLPRLKTKIYKHSFIIVCKVVEFSWTRPCSSLIFFINLKEMTGLCTISQFKRL